MKAMATCLNLSRVVNQSNEYGVYHTEEGCPPVIRCYECVAENSFIALKLLQIA